MAEYPTILKKCVGVCRVGSYSTEGESGVNAALGCSRTQKQPKKVVTAGHRRSQSLR